VVVVVVGQVVALAVLLLDAFECAVVVFFF